MQERLIKGSRGFRLIEIIGVMVIVGVLTSISAAKVFKADNAVKREAVAAGVSDLNSRERAAWTKVKLSNDNWQNDAQVFTLLDTRPALRAGKSTEHLLSSLPALLPQEGFGAAGSHLFRSTCEKACQA